MRPEGVGQAECPGGIKFLLVTLEDDVRMQVLLAVLVNTRYDNDGAELELVTESFVQHLSKNFPDLAGRLVCDHRLSPDSPILCISSLKTVPLDGRVQVSAGPQGPDTA